MDKDRMVELLAVAKTAALKAGQEIMKVYRSNDFNVEVKDDNSPLTRADTAAHAVIQVALEVFDIPVLSEEGRDIPYDIRKHWNYIWMVDPLDGTREFIKRNDDFSVNIALISQGEPILGVIYAPVSGKLYAGAKGMEVSLRVGGEERVLTEKQKPDLDRPGLRVAVSRNYLNKDTKSYLETLTKPEVVTMGSSLKFMLLAEKLADVYPRFAPTMEWDTAAAHAILKLLGIEVIDKEGKSLTYNKKDLLNPYFRAT